jgi:hypothetical protein
MEAELEKIPAQIGTAMLDASDGRIVKVRMSHVAVKSLARNIDDYFPFHRALVSFLMKRDTARASTEC